MANHFLRLSSSFAYVPVKLDGKKKKNTVFAHIVGGVGFEGLELFCYYKYKQKMKKDEPKKTKKKPSCFFVFSGLSFFVFCLYLNKKLFLAPSKWTPPTM